MATRESCVVLQVLTIALGALHGSFILQTTVDLYVVAYAHIRLSYLT